MIHNEKDFFIAIDSDGCVFDTMEIKHKECFCPATIKHFALQSVSKYAREVWEFVNLYSPKRGTNRFPALVAVLDLLRMRRKVIDRGAAVPTLPTLKHWIANEQKLGNPALEKASHKSDELRKVHDWSIEVNRRVANMVYGIPPFPMVRESLTRARQVADLIVSSGTPLGALHREWDEHALTPLVKRIAGQEDGTKTQHLTAAAANKYAPDRMLMIGDAPGDLKAAQNVQAFFYPIIPGQEDISWHKFHEEALDRFLSGRYAGAYQVSLIQDLNRALPSRPPWT